MQSTINGSKENNANNECAVMSCKQMPNKTRVVSKAGGEQHNGVLVDHNDCTHNEHQVGVIVGTKSHEPNGHGATVQARRHTHRSHGRRQA